MRKKLGRKRKIINALAGAREGSVLYISVNHGLTKIPLFKSIKYERQAKKAAEPDFESLYF